MLNKSSSLTEDEYKYAAKLAVQAICSQLAVPDTAFSAGRDTLKAHTSNAQQIRIFDNSGMNPKALQYIMGYANITTTLDYRRVDDAPHITGMEFLNCSDVRLG